MISCWGSNLDHCRCVCRSLCPLCSLESMSPGCVWVSLSCQSCCIPDCCVAFVQKQILSVFSSVDIKGVHGSQIGFRIIPALFVHLIHAEQRQTHLSLDRKNVWRPGVNAHRSRRGSGLSHPHNTVALLRK